MSKKFYNEMNLNDFLELVKNDVASEMRTCPDQISFESMRYYLGYIRGIKYGYRLFVLKTLTDAEVREFDVKANEYIDKYHKFLNDRVI